MHGNERRPNTHSGSLWRRCISLCLQRCFVCMKANLAVDLFSSLRILTGKFDFLYVISALPCTPRYSQRAKALSSYETWSNVLLWVPNRHWQQCLKKGTWTSAIVNTGLQRRTSKIWLYMGGLHCAGRCVEAVRYTPWKRYGEHPLVSSAKSTILDTQMLLLFLT